MNRAALIALCAGAVGCEPAEPAPLRPPHPVSSSTAELRPTDPNSGLMWTFAATEVVESYASPDGGFRVHFTRDGGDQVPLADADDSGVPDFVEQVANVYDDVGNLYDRVWGFRRPLSDGAAPDNGGDARFDVYLLNTGIGADGSFRVDNCLSSNQQQCFGYVVQENDFVGFGYPSPVVGTIILGSHEYFHAVQAAYDDNQDAVVSEGTAVWATKNYDPSTTDFEGFINGYLRDCDLSIDTPPAGPVPDFAYGSAIFFKFLSERYDHAVVRKMWEHCENGHGLPSEPLDQADPHWLVQLDAVLKADYQSSFAQAFTEFATWNLYMGSAADPTRAYAGSGAYPQPKMSPVATPYANHQLRVFYASTQYYKAAASGRGTMTAALVDDPTTPEDDTAGLALLLASRRGGVNVEVKVAAQSTAGTDTVDTSGAATLMVGVVNTARSGNGVVLTKRPALCLGSPEEVAACVAAFSPADAGVDAGTPDGGTTPPTPPCGCGGMPASGWPLLALPLAVLGLLRRRRE